MQEDPTYNFQAIEAKWQRYWQEQGTFKAQWPTAKPKYYVLDMFPYPSGAGLHVGHPLGYIATDIVSRTKRLQGYNVLHPMGFDSFGLPAENYAIQTGTHPAVTTEQNIARYQQQLAVLGMSYDPDAWLRTSDPSYYRWTQWIFLQLFNSWYNPIHQRAEPIETLQARLAGQGTTGLTAAGKQFTAAQWQSFTPEKQYELLLSYRLAYLSYDYVNWCPALGTVLANEEVKDGLSERGGHPVERVKMRQWSLRITAYADRLDADLDTVNWPPPIVEMQRNWIGRSVGARVRFELDGLAQSLEVFTTRPDTLFGVSFICIAPEHPLLEQLAVGNYRTAVLSYATQARNRTERERQMEKEKTGAFTGSYAIHPFTQEKIAVWVADYVLMGYGTGAIMGVPAHDERDWEFAHNHALPIKPVYAGSQPQEAAYTAQEGALVINSQFLDGLTSLAAISAATAALEQQGVGWQETTYRLRDAGFSRQRYWGEPIPVVYRNGVPYVLNEAELPLQLPQVESYKPAGSGESPLAALPNWVQLPDGSLRETNTMPGWAGSSWYFARYVDPHNEQAFANAKKLNYWLPVDLYIGGSEHAVGHLLYARFWTKFLHDLGYLPVQEPFQQLVNQGMIQGTSELAYHLVDAQELVPLLANSSYQAPHWTPALAQQLQALAASASDIYISAKLIHEYAPIEGSAYMPKLGKTLQTVHLPVELVLNGIIKERELGKLPAYAGTAFICFAGYWMAGQYHAFQGFDPTLKWSLGSKFTTVQQVEKMSKRWYNVVNPDDLCREYGADTFRLYEMFLGPLEASKPWNTNGITGVHAFLKKLWRLFYSEQQWAVTQQEPTQEELKVLHQTLRKAAEDTERLSFNTTVPQFMICVNELQRLGCHKQAILEPLLVAMSPFAPHLAEELWQRLGHTTSIAYASYPAVKEEYLQESSFEYPISINGKVRTKLLLPRELSPAAVEEQALAATAVQPYLQGKPVKRVVVVLGKIVNIVV